jgi:flagellar basal body-associated protein FliL
MRFYASESAEPGPLKADQSKSTHRHPKLISTRSKKRLVRRLIVISIFALAFIIFWFFLHYLTTEKSPSQDSGAVSVPLTSFPS